MNFFFFNTISDFPSFIQQWPSQDITTPFAVQSSALDGLSNANIVTGSARQKAKKSSNESETPMNSIRHKNTDDLSMHHISSFQPSFDFGSPILKKM